MCPITDLIRLVIIRRVNGSMNLRSQHNNCCSSSCLWFLSPIWGSTLESSPKHGTYL
jgi:hypothetical protein